METKIARRIRKTPVLVTEFICVTDLVPENWRGWFWALISSNAPFSWGDNNRTFVTAERFYDHCVNCFDIPACFDEEDCMVTQGAIREWLKKIERLGQTYIDLEN